MPMPLQIDTYITVCYALILFLFFFSAAKLMLTPILFPNPRMRLSLCLKISNILLTMKGYICTAMQLFVGPLTTRSIVNKDARHLYNTKESDRYKKVNVLVALETICAWGGGGGFNCRKLLFFFKFIEDSFKRVYNLWEKTPFMKRSRLSGSHLLYQNIFSFDKIRPNFEVVIRLRITFICRELMAINRQ